MMLLSLLRSFSSPRVATHGLRPFDFAQGGHGLRSFDASRLFSATLMHEN